MHAGASKCFGCALWQRVVVIRIVLDVRFRAESKLLVACSAVSFSRLSALIRVFALSV